MSSLTVRSRLFMAIFRLFAAVISLGLFSGLLSAQAQTDTDLARVQQQLAEHQQKWQQAAIVEYELTLRKVCFCPLSDVLPIRFNIANNQVVSSRYDCSNSNIHFIRPESICDGQPDKRLNQTVRGLFELIEAAVKQKAETINIEYEPVYGYPVSIVIDYDKSIADEEVSYQVVDFKPVIAPLSATTADLVIDHQWTSSAMSSDHANSVMFYSAPSSVGGHRGIVRMRTGTEGSEFRFQEWSNLDGVHRKERIQLLKLNQGRWQYGDHQLEVGRVTISGTEAWVTVNFSTAFKTPPQVILALQTSYGGEGVSARVQKVSTTSMEVQLVTEDLQKFSGHQAETLAYLLVASPDASFTVAGNIQFELLSAQQPIELNHDWQTVAKGYQLRLEEDQTVDDEVQHADERINLMQINGVYLSQLVSDRDNDNAVLRSATDYFEQISRNKIRIDRLVTDKSCDTDQQCQEIAFGAKPCGGPWSFLIYSNRQTDAAVLSHEVASYNELNHLQNELEGLISDCAVTEPNLPLCAHQICVPKEPPSLPSIAAQMTRFVSDDALETFIKAGLLKVEQSRYNPYFLSPFLSPLLPAPGLSFSSGAERFSTTNIQETGVDEADFMKTDGRYLYVSGPNQQEIRVLEMHAQPYRVTKQSIIEMESDMESDNVALRGLYLLAKRSNQRPDLLTTVHTGYQNAGLPRRGGMPGGIGYYPWYWMDQKTEINIYNVSNPAQPAKLQSIRIDGGLLSSRQMGESLYVVTRYVPNIHPLPYGSGISPEQQVSDRVQRVELADLAQLLPTVSISNGEAPVSRSILVSARQTFLPPMPHDYQSSDLMTVSRFDLSNPSVPPQTTTVIGHSDTIYVSGNALYFATSHYGYEQFAEGLDGSQDNTALPLQESLIARQTTHIHKISLANAQPEYQGSASVEGLITGNEDQRRFRFSEYDQVLRVVTTGQWGKMGENRVTLLRDNETGHLDEITHLPNSARPQRLGKPGERLYATRFVNNRLFLVTFLQTDPLIAVDLSDPSDPQLQGELEIPGFSDYLHPINDKLLLGIGKHAIPTAGQGDGRFALFQGIRLGLFDISGDGPRELDSVVIGERGSSSEVLRDLHAFSFLPADPQTQHAFRFALPIAVNGQTFPGLNPANVLHYAKWSSTGLYLFEVDTSAAKPALRNTGVIKIADSGQNDRNWNDMSPGANRSVLWGDGIFYSHQTHVWSSDWLTPDQAIGPQ